MSASAVNLCTTPTNCKENNAKTCNVERTYFDHIHDREKVRTCSYVNGSKIAQYHIMTLARH